VRWLLVAFTLLLAGSCALPKAEVDETAAPFAYDVNNVCAVMVPKLCAAREGCCNAFGTGYRADLCHEREMALCQAGQAAYLSAPGQIDFRGDRVEACIAQGTNFFDSCGAFSLENRFLDQQCSWVPFEGHHTEGGSCDYAFECQKPTEPRTFVQCESGFCVYYRLVPEGAACAIGPGGTRICDVGLYCDLDTLGGNPPFTGICVKASPAGTSCDQSFYCGYGSYCDTASQSCQPRKPPNSPCATAVECESDNCIDGKCISALASEYACSSCPLGEVTNAPTPHACDPLSQNCGAGQSCDLDYLDGILDCTTSGGTGALHDLCDTNFDCATGLVCTGYRCTRPCCASLEFDLCGPKGACSLLLFDTTQTYSLQVCSYKPLCDPWSGGGGCVAPETVCSVAGTQSRPGCTAPSDNLTSPTLGQTCTFANDCDDSQVCTEGACHWLCKVQDFGAPAAGTVGGAPGQGGCPTGQTCARFEDSTWLGHCTSSGT
jgi:hypothetical protein